MEKVLHPYDKERMRLAMLKHEETFREQVHELHRLYRIQKMLMGSVNLDPMQQKQNTFLIGHPNQHHQQQQQQPHKINGGDHLISKNNITVKRPDEQVVVNMIKSNGQEQHVTKSNGNKLLDENEIELTLSLGPSAHNPRRRKTNGSESGHTHSSSSIGSNQSRKKSPNKTSNNSVRGANNNNNNNNNLFSKWSSNSNLAQEPETQPGFTNGQKNNPPWLYHALSLKLT